MFPSKLNRANVLIDEVRKRGGRKREEGGEVKSREDEEFSVRLDASAPG
jgi:hypothetical protein